MMDTTRRVVRADGRHEAYDRPVHVDAIYGLLNAEDVQIVRLRHLGKPALVMLCDAQAYNKAHRQINQFATQLYHANCTKPTDHQVFGDVFVAPEADFEEKKNAQL